MPHSFPIPPSSRFDEKHVIAKKDGNKVPCRLARTHSSGPIGKITTTELTRRKYDINLSIGSLAGAGSLEFLIPPSLVMIIYGILDEVSIARLFAAVVMAAIIHGLWRRRGRLAQADLDFTDE